MAIDAGELEDRIAVPIEFEPLEAVGDRIDVLGFRALAVRVLNAEQEGAAGVPGIEPVEQRRAGACSTVDAFLALAFTGTFTGGAILAFLTFGPMVDIKSTLMFLGVFKRRVVAYLILLPMLMTLLIGIWTNLNISL
jgi:hypothetical protein